MDIRQPDWNDLLRDEGLDLGAPTFRGAYGGVGVPVPRRVQQTLLSSSGMPLGLAGRPKLGVRPAWHEERDPITGETAWVLCFNCAEPVW